MLSFDEPVQARTLTATDLVFVSAPGTEAFSLTLDRPVVSPTVTNGLTVGFTLSVEDLRRIKANATLFSSNTASFLNFTSALIIDTSNQLIQFVSSVPVRQYVADNVAPTLSSFSLLSLNAGELRLSFSEPMDGASLIPSAITLQQTATGGASLSLTGGTVTEIGADRQTLSIALTQADITSIKLETRLATSQATSYVSLQSGAVKDVAGNNVTAVPTGTARQTTNYQADGARPSLVTWGLDLDMEQLSLTFDDVMDRDSLRTEFITLQSSGSGAASSYTLRSGSTTSSDGYEIVVDLAPADLNGIKERASLATSRDNSFLSFTAQLIDDQVPLAVTAVTPARAVQATNYTADATRPRLTAFNISLETQRLTLQFSESVNISSLIHAGLTLQNQNDGRLAGTSSLPLTGGTANPAVTGARFDLQFTVADLNRIKEIIGLGSDINDTYLAIAETAISDMAGNAIIEVPVSNATQASLHLPDNIMPTLDAVSFDLDSGVLSLTFSETVHALSLVPGRITIRSGQTSLSSFRRLTGGVVTAPNSTVVNVTLTSTDLNAVKADPTLAVTANTTFVTLSSGAIRDMNRNLIDGILDTAAVRASPFVNDTTSPVLTSFSFSPGTSLLQLTFSETINAGLFQPNEITIKSNAVGVDFTSVRLTGGTFDTVTNSISVDLTLNTADINNIKTNTGLGTSTGNTYIAFSSRLGVDMFGNAITAVFLNASIGAIGHTPDTVPPVLEQFIIDLDQEFIELSFSESVLVSSFSPQAIVVQSSSSRVAVDSRQLTGSARVNATNGPVVRFYLNAADLNFIKSRSNLATSAANTFISFASTTITDMAGIPVTSQLQTNATAVLPTGFTRDTTNPQLTAFSIRMNGTASAAPPLILVLTFSEFVDASTLVATRFTLQPAQNNTNASESYQLTQTGSVNRVSETVLELVVDAVDLAGIRALQPLAQAVSNSFISAEAAAVQDAFSNDLDAVDSSAGIPATTNTADLVPPSVLSYTLDLNTNQLVLTMSEAVTASSVRPERITLQSAGTSSASSVSLNSATVSMVAGSIGTLLILPSDQFRIKQLDQLAVSLATTYISAQQGYVQDIAENPANTIPVFGGIRAATYIRDATRPRLLRWDLNLNTRQVTLQFDQVVNVSTLETTGLIIQQNRVSVGQSRQLTGGRLLTTAFNDSLVFEMLNTDANAIKQLTSLAVDNSSTYLVAPSTSIRDMSGK